MSGAPSCDNYLCGACPVRPEMILKQEAVIPHAVPLMATTAGAVRRWARVKSQAILLFAAASIFSDSVVGLAVNRSAGFRPTACRCDR